MNDLSKILIAYDGSSCADQALEDLARAGLPARADAYIVTVAEAWPPGWETGDDAIEREAVTEVVATPRVYSGDTLHEARLLAKSAARQLGDRFPGWRITTLVNSEPPAYGILAEAEGINPDLIVLGSHGRSAVGRLILGSVSQKVLADARCSVRIARHHPAVEGSPVRIVLGVDGTPDSRAAVAVVAARSWPNGSSVQVIAAQGSVDMFVPPIGSYMTEALQESVAEQRMMLEKGAVDATETLRAAGLGVTAQVKDGAPVPVLLEAAREWGADTIFVGAQGHRFLERVLLGSVSAAVAARAHCSVEVVRTR